MALEILEQNGTYQIRGKINSQNIGALKIYFQSILEKYDSIVVNLERLEYIDIAVAYYLNKLRKSVILQNKSISIISGANEKIKKVLHKATTQQQPTS